MTPIKHNHAWAVKPSERCPACDLKRTGPYRLADGAWSDGVDRTHVIPSHEFSKANPDRVYVHSTWVGGDLWSWQPLFDVWHGDASLEYELSYAEAVAYADKYARLARTNQGRNK